MTSLGSKFVLAALPGWTLATSEMNGPQWYREPPRVHRKRLNCTPRIGAARLVPRCDGRRSTTDDTDNTEVDEHYLLPIREPAEERGTGTFCSQGTAK